MTPKLKMYMVYKEGNLVRHAESSQRQYFHETLPGWYAYQRQWFGPLEGWFGEDEQQMYEVWCKENMSGIYIVTKDYVYLTSEDDVLLFKLTWID